MVSRRCALVWILSLLMTRASEAATEVAAWQGDTIVLGPQPTRLTLQPTDHIDLAATLAQASNRRFTLVLRGLATNGPPGTGYSVFLNLPEGVKPGEEDAGLAGAVSFFGVSSASADTNARAISFEVSDVLQRLRRAGRLGGALSVTIIPTGNPSVDSRPTINKIALFEY